MIFLIVVYILRVGIMDGFYSVTTCRLFLDKDIDDYLEFEDSKLLIGFVSDILDFLTAIVILYLFHHYLRKQYHAAKETRRSIAIVSHA